jgi:hypothetical protein
MNQEFSSIFNNPLNWFISIPYRAFLFVVLFITVLFIFLYIFLNILFGDLQAFVKSKDPLKD